MRIFHFLPMPNLRMEAVKVMFWVKNQDWRSVGLKGEYWLGILDWRNVDGEVNFQMINLIADDIPLDRIVPADPGALLQV